MWQHSPMVRKYFSNDDGGAGGGNPPASTPGSTPAGNDSGGTENNAGNDEANLSAFWNTASSPAATDDPQKVEVVNQPNTEEEKSPLDTLQTKISAMDFGGTVSDEVKQQIGEGNFEGLGAMMNKVGQEAVLQGVVMAAKMMNTNQEQMKAEITRQVRGHQSTSEATNAMRAAMPFTEKPEISPIAEGIMAQALRKENGDIGKAVGLTKRFFTEMLGITASDLGVRTVPSGNPGAGGIHSNLGDESGPDIDWAKDIFGMMDADKPGQS